MTDEELKLLGLRLIGQQQLKMLESIVAAACQITGETDQTGHTSDWIWDESNKQSAADLLAKFPDRPR